MKTSFEIMVAGAGIAGLSAALMLASGRSGGRMHISVVDAGAAPAPARTGNAAGLDLRVSAISAGSQALLEAAGGWPGEQLERCCPFDRMRVWDAASDPAGTRVLRFDADEFAVPHLGHIVENKLLQATLLAALAKQGVTVQFGTDVTGTDFGGSRPVVSFADGTSRSVDLVIAADGHDSPLRTYAGLAVWEHPYRQSALVVNCHTAQAHRNTAFQCFLPNGPLGLLPLADGRVAVVWTDTPEQVEGLLDIDDAALGRALTAAVDGVLGEMRPAGPRAAFPLTARHARQYVRHGLALIGDAAHAIHPLAGQGANLGIADARTLADVIERALLDRENPADRPVLRRYERARKGPNAAMLHFLTGLNRLFASDSVFLGDLRRAGIALFNRSGPVRKTIAGIALGSAAGK